MLGRYDYIRQPRKKEYHKMEKAVIYARYSSDKQTEQSIEGQVRECETFAKGKNLSVIGRYFDRALTGKVDKRPDFQRMVKDSGKKLFDYIIVYQLDRFARNRYDSAHYKNLLKKNGVKVLSAKENIADDPSGILMETVLEGMAEYYSAELAQKVRRGLYEGFLKGHNSGGGRCYGYDCVPVGQATPSGRVAKKFVINNAEAEIVRKIFDDYASGTLVRDIKKWLDTNGIKGKKGEPIHKNGIMHILKNKKYIGVLSFGGESREDLLPAIVDKDIFDRAQARINRNKQQPSSFKARARYLLSTKSFCGHCLGIMTADSGINHQGNVYRYYKCYQKKKFNKPCEKNQLVKENFELSVVERTLALLKTNGMIGRIAERLVAYNDELQSNPKLELYEQQLRETEKKIANMVKAVQQGFYNQTMQDTMLQLESEKADLHFRIDGEKLDIPIKLDYDRVLFYFEQFANGDPNDAQFRERLIDGFINKVIVWNDRMIITYNIAGTDGEKVTADQIIKDFEKQRAEPKKFDSRLVGAKDGT